MAKRDKVFTPTAFNGTPPRFRRTRERGTTQPASLLHQGNNGDKYAPLNNKGGFLLSCPEPGTHVTNQQICEKFEAVSIARIERLATISSVS